MNYAQAYKDHKYLWSIGPAVDMTGSYVDQEDLARMLETPTKAMAAQCLCSQIEYWFDVGPDNGKDRAMNVGELIRTNERVREIAERHGQI